MYKTFYGRLLGIAALFSGTALIIHIISGLSLRLALALTASLLLLVATSIWRRASDEQRNRLVTIAILGILSGMLATAAYDSAKFVLSQWDTSPYNPFEAIRVFGVLLAGPSATTGILYTAGTLYHLLNGIAFGTAFCFLISRTGLVRYGIVAGVAWGLFLETFQLTLYPGWLNIGFYREFAQISALAHIVYGAVLGLACWYGLTRWVGDTG